MSVIKVTVDIKTDLPIIVNEVDKGHKYTMAHRHSEGSEELNFAKFMTYQEMVDAGMDSEFINSIVPEENRNDTNCCMFLVSPGIFTQDAIEALIKRMEYQYSWFRHGFYTVGIDALKTAKKQYELFTAIRKKYGFYHIPFTFTKFIEEINLKTEDELEGDRFILSRFLELKEGETWSNKKELIDLIQHIRLTRNTGQHD